MCIRKTVSALYVFTVLQLTSGESSYYIKDFGAGATWSNANQTCVLATPKITYQTDGYSIDDPDIALNLNVGDTVWLGYVTAFQTFQYRGCEHLYDINKDIGQSFTVPLDPGACSSACGNNTKYIAIGTQRYDTKYNNCYCLQSKIQDKVRRCRNSCEFPQGVACGDNIRKNVVSVYEHITTPLLDNQDDPMALCCSYEAITAVFRWAYCNYAFRLMCSKEMLLNSSVNVYKEFKSWIDAANECFDYNSYPVTYGDLTSNTSLTSQLWTGMVRSHVILRVITASHVVPTRTAYMEVGLNVTYIRFSNNSAKTTTKALCLQDHMKVTPTATEQSSTNAQNKNFTQIGGQHENKTNLVSVYAGVAVAVFIAVVVSVGGYVCYRKRRDGQNNQHVYENEQTTRSNTNHNKVIGASVIYQNQPKDSLYPGGKREDEHQTVYDIKAAGHEDNNYITPIQDAYEETAKRDTVTFNKKRDDTSEDDNSEYVYPAQGPYEDLKHLQEHTSEIYNQLQKSDPSQISFYSNTDGSP